MNIGLILITLGVVLLLGLVTDVLGRRTPLPRVTLLMLLGFIMGPSVSGVLPADSERWFPLIANLALAMVGFLLGEQPTMEAVQHCGRMVFSVSVVAVLVTAGIVSTGLILLGFPVEGRLSL